MSVKKLKGDDGVTRWHTVNARGKTGKRGFLTRATAEEAQERGRAIGLAAAAKKKAKAGKVTVDVDVEVEVQTSTTKPAKAKRKAASKPRPASKPTPKPRTRNMGKDTVGTRNKSHTTLTGKVAMETVLVPRRSDLAGLLKGLVQGMQPGVATPDFSPAAENEDSDDVAIGRAMGEALGPFMASIGMTAADWKALTPAGLGEGPSFLDGLGLGGGVVEMASGVGLKAAGGILETITGGILGGDDALLDLIPGDQGGSALDLFGNLGG